MKTIWIGAAALIAAASLASAETKSGLTESIVIGGKIVVSIAYSSPAVNKREGKLFGKDGQVGSDSTYPVWRAGANKIGRAHV